MGRRADEPLHLPVSWPSVPRYPCQLYGVHIKDESHAVGYPSRRPHRRDFSPQGVTRAVRVQVQVALGEVAWAAACAADQVLMLEEVITEVLETTEH